MSWKNPEELANLVAAVMESYDQHPVINNIGVENRLNKSEIIDLLEEIRCVVFPGFFEAKHLNGASVSYHLGEVLEDIHFRLQRQIVKAFHHGKEVPDTLPEDPEAKADEIARAFLCRIPDMRSVLATDVQAAYDGDPAAFNTDETIFSYPGVFAISVNRIAHELHVLGVPMIPRMMTEYAHSLTGIDIHPGATIGRYFFIDHGTGVVVGETTEIGNGVKIYQGVTLGALSTRGGQSLRNKKRHPTLEDNVTVYAGASILGGETVIGEGAVIGSNVFITSSVPKGTKVSIKNPDLQFLEPGKKSSPVTELEQEGFRRWKE